MLSAGRFISLFLILMSCSFIAGCSSLETKPVISGTERAQGTLEVHFIDVGLGDSTLIRSDNGESILIDTGSPAGGIAVVDYLRKNGIRKIDHLIITHPHDDHFGGIFSVLANFETGRIYDNGFSNFRSELYGDYISAVRSDLSRYQVLQAGASIRSGSLVLKVLNPLLPPTGKINEDSIMIKAAFGDVSLLLAGDVGIISERRLLQADADIKSAILKVGHHGENDALSDEFLAQVNPESAIISVSSINKYGRPHPELLERLRNAGVSLYRTDRDGDILITTDGSSYSIGSSR